MTDTAPPAVRPACARLAEGLRELRTRTGLSMVALAERTGYSKSSWERYLNGKQLAPRKAVEALCSVAGEPPGRLMALWELADLEWSGRAHSAVALASHAATAPSPDDRPGTRASPGGGGVLGPARRWTTGRRAWALAAAACVVGFAAVAWVTVLPGSRDTTEQAVPTAPACRTQGCAGKKPEAMGCAMPGQVRHLGQLRRASGGALLRFAYGEQCRTAWVVVWNTHVGDRIEVSVPGSRPQGVTVADRYDAEDSLLTPMVDGSDLTGLRACVDHEGHTACLRPRYRTGPSGGATTGGH